MQNVLVFEQLRQSLEILVMKTRDAFGPMHKSTVLRKVCSSDLQ